MIKTYTIHITLVFSVHLYSVQLTCGHTELNPLPFLAW